MTNLTAPSELMALLDIQFDEVEPTRVSGSVAADERHHQPWGLVHGGLYTTAIETFATTGALRGGQGSRPAGGRHQQPHRLRAPPPNRPPASARERDPPGPDPTALAGRDPPTPRRQAHRTRAKYASRTSTPEGATQAVLGTARRPRRCGDRP